MSFLDGVQLYCEHSAAGLWAETCNVLSTGAFLFVAWSLWRRHLPSEARREARRIALLIGLLGIGSLTFHMSEQEWAYWFSAGTIALFIAFFLQRYLKRVVRTHNGTFLLGLVGMLVCGETLERLGGLGLNGSEYYIGPAVGLVILARWALEKSRDSASWMLLAACLLPVALAVRSLDQKVCSVFPLGTHFLWHLLAAAVLYLCVRGLAAGCHERSSRYHGLLTSDTVIEKDYRRR